MARLSYLSFHWRTPNQPRDLHRHCPDAVIVDTWKAADVLIDHCRLGFVNARAVLMQRANGARPDDWHDEEREWDVPVGFWAVLASGSGGTKNWERGLFAARTVGVHGAVWLTLTGVHFFRPSLDVFLAAGQSPVAVPSAKGGRPAAEYWDELWCATWGEIYRGSLQPRKQGDIEKAMLGWLAARNFESAVSTVRARARLLWAAYQREDENPPQA